MPPSKENWCLSWGQMFHSGPCSLKAPMQYISLTLGVLQPGKCSNPGVRQNSTVNHRQSVCCQYNTSCPTVLSCNPLQFCDGGRVGGNWICCPLAGRPGLSAQLSDEDISVTGTQWEDQLVSWMPLIKLWSCHGHAATAAASCYLCHLSPSASAYSTAWGVGGVVTWWIKSGQPY